ncbi:CAP domain-containing protein [Nonomuraea gerenzanensis]|nr:CAP domain-containing protein [Nonomuraea gerenzanensis]UBU15159.1 CAP domain-containing protein [Nonomuraea gerenzanensis]
MTGPTGMAGTRPALPDATNAAFLLEALREANARRDRHGVPPLAMDPLLVEYAKTRAAELSSRTGSGAVRAGTGEIAYRSEGDDMSQAAEAVASWYAQSAAYDHDDPRPCGFSQLIWKASKAMGAARVAGQGPSQHETYIVFVFEPPGNVEGTFQENVPRA